MIDYDIHDFSNKNWLWKILPEKAAMKWTYKNCDNTAESVDSQGGSPRSSALYSPNHLFKKKERIKFDNTIEFVIYIQNMNHYFKKSY